MWSYGWSRQSRIWREGHAANRRTTGSSNTIRSLSLRAVPGSIVEFPNHDPWLHNVFSVSRSKRFDLGLYVAGVRKAVTFDRPGVWYLFCSIHPEMMAIVLAVDSAYFGVSDNTGRISIAGVPHGKYVLHVWHENSAPQILEALQRTISVGDDDRSLPTISIALSSEVLTINQNDNSEQATFADGK